LLPHYLAAPTLISIGGVPHLADRLRLGDFALLLQAAEDGLARDPDDEPLRFSDPDVLAWLFSDGLPLVFWCTLRRQSPGICLADAFALAAESSVDEQVAVTSAALRHGKRATPGSGSGEAVDIALQKWGRVLRRLASEGKGLPTEIAEYTVDQVGLMLAGEDPETYQENVEVVENTAKMMAAYAEILAQRAAAQPTEITLESLGYAVVPGQDQEIPEGSEHGDEHGDGGDRWHDDAGAIVDERG
jgi:hypothetical protein